MIVALAASTAFMTPVRRRLTRWWSPGNYTFGDFVKIGVPFSLVVLTFASSKRPLLLPLYLPFSHNLTPHRTVAMSQPSDAPKPIMQRFLDVVEKVGNKVPHPVVIFLILIAIVVVIAHLLYATERPSPIRSSTRDAQAEDATATPEPADGGGIRFLYCRSSRTS
jgi:hypothetical protein